MKNDDNYIKIEDILAENIDLRELYESKKSQIEREDQASLDWFAKRAHVEAPFINWPLDYIIDYKN